MENERFLLINNYRKIDISRIHMINGNVGPFLHKDSTLFISFFLQLDMAQ